MLASTFSPGERLRTLYTIISGSRALAIDLQFREIFGDEYMTRDVRVKSRARRGETGEYIRRQANKQAMKRVGGISKDACDNLARKRGRQGAERGHTRREITDMARRTRCWGMRIPCTDHRAALLVDETNV